MNYLLFQEVGGKEAIFVFDVKKFQINRYMRLGDIVIYARGSGFGGPPSGVGLIET